MGKGGARRVELNSSVFSQGRRTPPNALPLRKYANRNVHKLVSFTSCEPVFLCLLRAGLDLETEAGHAAPVLLDSGLAVGLGVRRLGEEHALVAPRLLVLADAAGLSSELSGQQGAREFKTSCPSYGLERELAHTLGLDSASTGLASGFVAREASDC